MIESCCTSTQHQLHLWLTGWYLPRTTFDVLSTTLDCIVLMRIPWITIYIWWLSTIVLLYICCHNIFFRHLETIVFNCQRCEMAKKKLSDNTSSRRYCGRVHFDLTGPCNVLLDRFDFNFSWLSSQALDAKVIIFKKKRRKNYRRTKGHRQVNLYFCSLYYILFLKDTVTLPLWVCLQK